MVEPQSSKLVTRVRFPSSPPSKERPRCGRSFFVVPVERCLGFDEVDVDFVELELLAGCCCGDVAGDGDGVAVGVDCCLVVHGCGCGDLGFCGVAVAGVGVGEFW